MNLQYWSEKLEVTAQKWAQTCNEDHDSFENRAVPGKDNNLYSFLFLLRKVCCPRIKKNAYETGINYRILQCDKSVDILQLRSNFIKELGRLSIIFLPRSRAIFYNLS